MAIGPLTFSYAVPLSEAKTDITEKFRFQIGTSFNEKNIHSTFLLLNSNFGYASKIAYLDVQFIMDNSKLGIKYKRAIKYQIKLRQILKKLKMN